MQLLEFDTIIIGSGLAGLTAAYHAAQFGTVAVVTKSELDTSNSYYAQGGIAAAIGEDDSPQLHLADTLEAGRGLCDRDAVEVLVTEGRERVLELIDMGMPFDRVEGKIVPGLEGGHHKRRILHAGGDATGKMLTCFMLQKVREQKNITAFEYTAAVRLIENRGCILGVQAIDFVSGENIVFRSKAVILATGGLSRIFSRSTNPHTATGDGIAMAYQIGAKLADMEFVQFHPSALSLPGEEAFLISEAVRGEGAWLLTPSGERFMPQLHPLAELAPRDVVAYSIFKQMQQSGHDFVYLSLRHLDPTHIAERFHNIYFRLKEYGIDLTCDLVPVAPAAHYMVGGIRTDLNAETNIRGLFVCGEAASTGVMGANRLASNSLLECLVFGKRASEQAARLTSFDGPLPELETVTVSAENEQLYLQYKNEMAELLSEKLGIVRNQNGMQESVQRFNEIAAQFGDAAHEYNLLKIKNTVDICRLIAHSALIREESRGGHIREDFPEENPQFRVHIIQQKDHEPTFEPVNA